MSENMKEIESRTIRIQLVSGTKISGQININRDDGHDRLSDLISSDRGSFLVAFNVTLNRADLDKPVKHKTMFINKDHIEYATPDDTQK